MSLSKRLRFMLYTSISYFSSIKQKPIIGILCLIIPSILIVRDALFMESGMYTFGDTLFTLPPRELEFILSMWNDKNMSIYNTWQIPRQISYFIIYNIVGETLYTKIIVFLPYFLTSITGGIVIYLLISEYVNTSINKIDKNAIVFLGGIAYLAVPIIIHTGGLGIFAGFKNNIMITMPLFLYIVLTKRKLTISSILVIVLVIVLFMNSPRELLFLLSFTIILLIITFIIKLSDITKIIQFCIFITILILATTYIWLPFLASGINKPLYINYNTLTYVDNILTYDALKHLSSNQDLINVLRGLGRFSEVVDYDTTNIYLYDIWFIISFLIPIMAFSSLLIIRYALTKIILSLSILIIIQIFLVKGINPPFGEFYTWLTLEAPLYGLNWIFRSPAKFFYYMAFPTVLLFLLYITNIIFMIKKYKQLIYSSFIIIIILFSWPLYTGNMKNNIHLTNIPKEYTDLAPILNNTQKNILWLPPYADGNFIWSNVTRTPDPIAMLTPIPYHSNPDIFLNILILLDNKEYNKLMYYLQLSNIGYIAFRYDNPIWVEKYKNILNEFELFIKHLNVTQLYNGQYVKLYMIDNIDNTTIFPIYVYDISSLNDKNIRMFLNQTNIIHIQTYIWHFDEYKEYKEWNMSSPFTNNYPLLWEDGTLVQKLYISSPGWKVISTPSIAVGNIRYSISFDIATKNAYNTHFKILEFNDENQLIHVSYAGGIKSNSNWEKVDISYIIKNNDTKYIKFQIWHGHNTNTPLPNEILLDNFTIAKIKYKNPILEYNEYKIIDIYDLDKNFDTYIYDIPKNLDNTKILVIFPFSYNPNWTANGIKSIQILGLNGFILNNTDKIIIEFAPNKWLYIGIVISLITITSISAYILYKRVIRKYV